MTWSQGWLLGWCPGWQHKLLKYVSCHLPLSFPTAAVCFPKGHSSEDVSCNQLRLKIRRCPCLPQHRVSRGPCMRYLGQKGAVFNLSQEWARGWRSPTEQLRWMGKTQCVGWVMPCTRNPWGSSVGATHLPAGPVLAGSVGRGDVDSASLERVLAPVSMWCVMLSLSQVLWWPRSGIWQ